MKDYLLWRKISRIIILLAKRLNISSVDAMSLFYSSNIGHLIHNNELQINCFSDEYLVDELILELQNKQ